MTATPRAASRRAAAPPIGEATPPAALARILTPGERVLWAATPHWDDEKPAYRYWVRRGLFAVCALVLLAVAALSWRAGDGGLAAVVGAFAIVIAFGALARSGEELRRDDAAYALTDRRAIAVRADGEERFSVALGAIVAFDVRRNGAVRDLTLRFGAGDEDVLTFFALAQTSDAEAVLAEAFLGSR
ncbi:MAG: hypothetical protein AAGC56_13735 [Pseudomonadota bacterium]